MAGGLMQLVAYGAQDVYLTGNPQITFWKVVYRRHTNFAVESIEQVFNGSGDFNKKVVCQIQRNGDLITKVYLRVGLPALASGNVWVSKIGHAMLNYITLNIGGTDIDKQYGDWFNVWYELSRKFAHDRGYAQMIGDTTALTSLQVSPAGTVATTLYVPLYFFHCRNDGLALPLIATQYHDTRIEIQFNAFNTLINSMTSVTAQTTASLATCSLFVDYVYLDSEERKKFAQASHEYLIEQLQFTGAESVTSVSSKFRLNFNHPCKALYWNVQQTKYTAGNSFLAYVPNDWQATKVLATKRAVLAYGDLTFANNNNGVIVAKSGLSRTSATQTNFTLTSGVLSDLFTAINAAKCVMYADISNNSPTVNYALNVNNIEILGHLLPDDLVSATIAQLGSTFDPNGTQRNTTGDGAANGSKSTEVGSVTPSVSGVSDVRVWDYTNYGTYLNKTINPISQVLLQLNGQDRFSVREGMYFNYVQPWQHHSNTPADGINMYSFSLNPEEHQPSGTCNMSRIDNATLNLTFNDSTVATNATIKIYATNYNVLRIMSGMAGLAYSN